VIQERSTALRGLDYLHDRTEIDGPRLKDPIALLVSHRRPNGVWPLEQRIPGVVFFDMQKPGGDSRWNALRTRRILRGRTPAHASAPSDEASARA
jgi:hypothetical protein